MAYTNTKKLQWAPSAANGVSVVSSGTAWVNSSWVEVITSASGAIQIEQLMMEANSSSGGHAVEVDIGTGTAGNEVVIATTRGFNQSQYGDAYAVLFPILIDNVANGIRVAVRLRYDFSFSSTFTIAIGYYSATDSTHTTTHAQQVVPSAAAGVSVTGVNSTPWPNSSYGQLTSGIANALWLTALSIGTNGNTDRAVEVDIATGGAGSEVVQTTLRFYLPQGNGDNNIIYLSRPLPVATNTRIAVRWRNSNDNGGTGTSDTWTFALMYYVQDTVVSAAVFTKNINVFQAVNRVATY